MGLIVKSGEFETNSIDLSKLNAGLYFIKIFEINSEKISIARIIKE